MKYIKHIHLQRWFGRRRNAAPSRAEIIWRQLQFNFMASLLQRAWRWMKRPASEPLRQSETKVFYDFLTNFQVTLLTIFCNYFFNYYVQLELLIDGEDINECLLCPIVNEAVLVWARWSYFGQRKSSFDAWFGDCQRLLLQLIN